MNQTRLAIRLFRQNRPANAPDSGFHPAEGMSNWWFMPTFVRRTHIAAPVERVFRWHELPGLRETDTAG
jgi:hypothetical protein